MVLIGSDTIAGTTVWHIKGTSPQPGFSGTEDLYVTKDTYLAKKMVFTETETGTGGNRVIVTITELFTAYNTGITIDLPPTNQIA